MYSGHHLNLWCLILPYGFFAKPRTPPLISGASSQGKSREVSLVHAYDVNVKSPGTPNTTGPGSGRQNHVAAIERVLKGLG